MHSLQGLRDIRAYDYFLNSPPYNGQPYSSKPNLPSRKTNLKIRLELDFATGQCSITETRKSESPSPLEN